MDPRTGNGITVPMSNIKTEERPHIWAGEKLKSFLWLTHGMTERTGGSSSAPFASLNLGLHVGDVEERVRENRERAAAASGMNLHHMVCAEQVHGSRVAVVTANDAGRGATVFSDAIAGVDALVTDEKELLLTLFFADCLPILFADDEHRAVAIAHAGWRGLAGGVIENTLKAMAAQFGSRPESVTAVIGPGIGPCCFEVGPEVAENFPPSVLRQETQSKPHVDLPGDARLRLLAAGVTPEQIESADICTACHTERFFSHRRERGRTGRMGAFIAKRN